jgi:hypothetical protein
MSNMLDALKKDKNRGRATIKAKRLIASDDGKYQIQIFPNSEDEENGLPYFRVFLHFGFMHPNFNNPGTFRCLGRDCPLCREAKKMKESGDKNAWRFLSTPVFLYYVLDSQNTIKFLRLSSTAHEAVVDELIAKQKSKINPVKLSTSRIASFEVSTVTDKGKTRKSYKCFFQSEHTPIPANKIEEFQQLQPFDEIYRVWTREDLEKVVKGEKIVFGRTYNTNSTPTATPYKPENRAQNITTREEIPGVDDGTMDSIPEETARPAMISGGDYDHDDKPSEPVKSSTSTESLEDAKARIRASLGDD